VSEEARERVRGEIAQAIKGALVEEGAEGNEFAATASSPTISSDSESAGER
jgi:hypothetical protein